MAKKAGLRLVIVMLSGVFVLCGSVWADVLLVPSAEHPTIQAAINASVNGDTVIVEVGAIAWFPVIDSRHKAYTCLMRIKSR